MSATVWKYAIPSAPLAHAFTLDMPEGAKPLTVQMQDDEPQVWALVDPNAPITKRQFMVTGTGHHFIETVSYIGTFQIANGVLVFHVFEVQP